MAAPRRADRSRCPALVPYGLNHRWMAWSIAAIVVLIVLGIVLGWELKTTEIKPPAVQAGFAGRRITADVDLVAADPIAGSVTLDWTITDDSCFGSDTNTNPTNCPIVDIYFDENLLFREDPDTEEAPTNNVPSAPIFKFNASGLVNERNNLPYFRTRVNLNNEIARLESTPENYPFDQYSAELFFYGQQESDNATVLISIGEAHGVAVGFKAKISRSSLADIPLSGIDGLTDIVLLISRASLVKVYVIIIVATMWLISLAFAVITIKCVLFGHGLEASILVIPVATLFAFTSLRAAMPGAPSGFGAIVDFVGTLPTLAFLAVESFLCLMHLIIRPTQTDPDQVKPRLQAYESGMASLPML